MVQVEERVERPARGLRSPGGAPWWRRRQAPSAAALLGWAGLVVGGHLWGRQLMDAGHRLQLGPGDAAPPIVGHVDLRLGVRVLPGLALATIAVLWGPWLAARLRWRHLLAAAALGAAGFAVALAVVDPGGLTQPLLGRGEYLRDVGDVGSPLGFLDHFTDRLATYHTHVQGHPPGMVLLLWAFDRAGLGGAGWAAALVVAGGAAAVPATMVTLRATAGEATARAAAPFLVLAPAAIWVASTADALYMGVVATGIALLALAGARPGDGRGDVLAVAAGVVLGAACLLTYGAVLAAPLAAAVALAQRRWRPLLIAAVAALIVVAAFAAAGFWWPAGLAATRHAYFAGVAGRRPYAYFLSANLGAFALVVGPAAAVALTRLRWVCAADTSKPGRSLAVLAPGPLALLTGGALLAVVLADLSGLSKGEVERIWLPFAPWVLAATAGLGRSRAWLGLQAGTALALAVSVRTPW